MKQQTLDTIGKYGLRVLGVYLGWKILGPERQERVIEACYKWMAAPQQEPWQRETPWPMGPSLKNHLPPLTAPDFTAPVLATQGLPAAVPALPIPHDVPFSFTWDDLAAAAREYFAIKNAPQETPTMPTPQEEPDARWREVLVPPGVVLILGKRGSGKSALAYRLLELFRHRLTPLVVSPPRRARGLLPEWIGIAPSLEDLPQNCIALIDEAYLAYHARESHTDGSKAMSQLLNLSRQRNQTLLFVTQEARQVDRNIVSAASVVVFKELGLVQLEFERPELRKLVEAAREALDRQPAKIRRQWAYAYSPDTDFLGLLPGQLPSFWKPSLSKLFAGDPGPALGRPGVTLNREEKIQKAIELRHQGFSHQQIAGQLGVSKATVINYVKGYPYQPK